MSVRVAFERAVRGGDVDSVMAEYDEMIRAQEETGAKWMAQSEKDRRAAERDREDLTEVLALVAEREKERDAAQAALEASDFVLKEERKRRETAEHGLLAEKRNSSREHENFRAAVRRAEAAGADNAALRDALRKLTGGAYTFGEMEAARKMAQEATHPGAALLEELRRLRALAEEVRGSMVYREPGRSVVAALEAIDALVVRHG